MEYAKVENGEVTSTGLPLSSTRKNGDTVSNFNLLPDYVLREEGYFPIVENRPEYNQETEYVEFTGYTVGETEVTAGYIVKPIIPTIPTPTLEERVSSIEDMLLMIL